MQLFDLLFIFVFLATLSLLVVACFSGRRGLRILRRLAVGLSIYFGVVIVVSLILPRKTFALGADQCGDDWCITVDRVDRKPVGSSVAFTVSLRLWSRAKRVSQRENNVSVYMTGGGRRYDAQPDKADVPFNVLLQPGESVNTARTFLLPAGVNNPALIVTRAGGFPIGWFIIGYDTWFRKPPILALK